jgi:hypothetical protein
MRYLLVLGVLFLLFSGCNSQPTVQHEQKSSKPAWILNPSMDGKVGAVGVAGRTYDQKESTKRKLAIGRALDELTLQRGVKVNLNMSKVEVVKNDRVSSTMDVKSDYKANSNVTAHIEQVWEDPLTQELYIWMVMD